MFAVRTLTPTSTAQWQGLWWLAGAVRDDSSAAMTQILAQSAGTGEDGTRLLEMAAQQRLSTDAQRAAFCCVMGASDPAQAAERLLRLPLKVIGTLRISAMSYLL